MKHIQFFTALMLFTFFSVHTYSQGCYYDATFSHVNNGGGIVSFTNSSSMISSSYWDFGDGNNSTQNNPTHTYTSNGAFTVTLYITYVWNMGVYGTLNCSDNTSTTIMINNSNSAYGCMNSSAANYNPSATIDDGSCIFGATFVTLQMNDSYGDGWNGNTWSATSNTGGASYGPFTISGSGYSGSQSFVLVDDCYDIICDFGMYQNEISWSLVDNNGTAIASGGAPYNSNICSYTIVSGCTDSLADNYNLSATVDDGSCTYSSTCSGDAITGLFVSDIIDDRCVLNFDNMNTYDASGNQICRVDQIRIRYRKIGNNSWSQKNIASPTGYDANGICNSTQKTDKNLYGLTLATTYEWEVKVWYCSGQTTAWAPGPNFTTAPECPNGGNFNAYGANPTKATFTWDDSNGAFEFLRIKIRVDSISNPSVSDFIQVGGAGVTYGTFQKDKNGLTPGETYRGQGRTWCNPNGGAYNSLGWGSFGVWTQPTNRIEGGSDIAKLDVYPNPSRDVFNVTFTSEDVQNLEVRVVNVVGEVVYREDLQQFVGEYTKLIDLGSYTKGVYFLEITTDNGVVNKKLIIQ